MPCEKQLQRLQSLPKTRYQYFIDLYQQVKKDGLESPTFNKLYKELHLSEVIFSFDWIGWQPAKEVWNEDYNFDNLSLLELAQHLSAIFRADYYNEGTVVSAYYRGLFEKIFSAMDG